MSATAATIVIIVFAALTLAIMAGIGGYVLGRAHAADATTKKDENLYKVLVGCREKTTAVCGLLEFETEQTERYRCIAQRAVEALPLPEAALQPTTMEMPTVIGEVTPVEVITTPSGRKVLDLGQNLTGHVRLRVTGRAGDVITLRHAEVLEHGEMGMRPLRGAACTD
ncbi:family 78 glycoside hydrolase catalytic domain, partial [Candidatus Nanosynsacchari sp. TM7_ANC_38.39_G1_1]|uniref:family 78 glycoside hydrolase catalytic domain n=1 Tax=Candidatus Nanosynsacchari sp. TM7_ANC_38.39_G1_1 TaxID=1986206 RepID=UPI0013EBF7FB